MARSTHLLPMFHSIYSAMYIAAKSAKHTATATYGAAPATAVMAPIDNATCHAPHDTAHDHAHPVSLHWRAKFFISSGTVMYSFIIYSQTFNTRGTVCVLFTIRLIILNSRHYHVYIMGDNRPMITGLCSAVAERVNILLSPLLYYYPQWIYYYQSNEKSVNNHARLS